MPSGPIKLKIRDRSTRSLLAADQAHEEFCIGCPSVIQLGDVWHMWYSAYDLGYEYDCDAFLCYARSRDGVRWEKPSLGRVPWRDGSRDNNIVIDGQKIRANATTVFLDQSAPPSERFKVLLQRLQIGENEGKPTYTWHNCGGCSPDGHDWKVLPDPIYPWNSDTQNVCFRDGDRYRMYTRLFRTAEPDGSWSISTEWGQKRIIGLTESPTFGNFPESREVLSPKADDPGDLDFYTNACTKIRDDLYLMFPSSYYREQDVVRVHAAYSRDGSSFERLGHDPVLDLGSGFDSATLYVAPGAFPGPDPNTYWFYYNGSQVKHNDNHPKKGARRAGGVGRFLVEIQE